MQTSVGGRRSPAVRGHYTAPPSPNYTLHQSKAEQLLCSAATRCRQGHLDVAMRDVVEAEACVPFDARCLFWKGRVAYLQHDFDRAWEWLSMVAEIIDSDEGASGHAAGCADFSPRRLQASGADPATGFTPDELKDMLLGIQRIRLRRRRLPSHEPPLHTAAPTTKVASNKPAVLMATAARYLAGKSMRCLQLMMAWLWLLFVWLRKRSAAVAQRRWAVAPPTPQIEGRPDGPVHEEVVRPAASSTTKSTRSQRTISAGSSNTVLMVLTVASVSFLAGLLCGVHLVGGNLNSTSTFPPPHSVSSSLNDARHTAEDAAVAAASTRHMFGGHFIIKSTSPSEPAPRDGMEEVERDPSIDRNDTVPPADEESAPPPWPSWLTSHLSDASLRAQDMLSSALQSLWAFTSLVGNGE